MREKVESTSDPEGDVCIDKPCGFTVSREADRSTDRESRHGDGSYTHACGETVGMREVLQTGAVGSVAAEKKLIPVTGNGVLSRDDRSNASQ